MAKTNKNNRSIDNTNNTNTNNTIDESTENEFVEVKVDYSEGGMPEDKIKLLAEKFISLKRDALLEVAKDYPRKKSLIVDYSELFKFNGQLCDELIDFPDKVIRVFEEVVNEQNIPVNFEGEVRFHVRFILPKGFNVNIRDITSEYINKFFCVEGVITRVSDVLPKVYIGVFQCPLCGKIKEVWQEKNRNLIFPSVCDYCKKTTKFKLLPEESRFMDIQRIEIQEPLEVLRGGEEARKIEVWLTDDLTGKVLPGNIINVVGLMKLIPPRDINDAVYRKFIDANNINIIDKEFIEVDLTEDDIKKIKEFAKSPDVVEKFVGSIGPAIYGYKEIKEAIALQLFGGSRFELPDKTKTRGEIHLLLIGDPGVAKSRLLLGASNIAPKSIYVSGKSTSAAGLTATAEKDEFAEGAWVLKAGALVLSSGGLACLHPKTNVLVNGKIKKIDELFTGKYFLARNKNEIQEIKEINLPVISYNINNLSIEKSIATRIRRKIYKGNMLEIKFKNNSLIKLTPDHLLLDNSMEWKPANKFFVGEDVIAGKGNNKIIEINKFYYEGFVYDLFVPAHNNFMTDSVIVHNCIDEFDKMEDEDRVAMHEALEQQTISIAKAGIVAKFRAETCVLAAANPKFGRFSSEKAIVDQFDIPPTLLSRFDLIFPLKDIMDSTQDQGIARHVLMAYSGKKEEQIAPPIDIEFIRKYIAYARKNLNPVLGEVAQRKIEEYYLRLRKESSKDIVQITPRQLEGIIRMSCASAKMRLKNIVEEDDVDRAIRLMEYSMRLIARDKETGKIDVDSVVYGPKEKRDKIKTLSEILEYLTENGKKHCFIEDFVKQAKEQGIDEKDARNFIENAKREGKIFEPRDGEIGMIL